MTAVIAFLCAATSATGAGHLSRCLAMAGAYRNAGWRTKFILTGDDFVHMLGEEHGWRLAEAGQTIATLEAIAPGGCEVLVIDDYARDETFEQECRRFARRIVVLDDQSGRRHRCDVVIDAAAADSNSYRHLVGDSTRILTGAKYALIRSDIARRRRTAIPARDARNVHDILLSFGATDPAGLTPATLDAVVRDLPDDMTLTVALSSRAGGIEAIRARTSQRIRLCLDADMGELIAAADLAIGAGGVGAFERAALGLPGIVVIAAENQEGLARLLVDAGAALDGGKLDADFGARIARQLVGLIGDTTLRANMARAAAALVDGRAADRIRLASAAGTTNFTGAELRLRAAELEDADWLLALQREPATRRFARNPKLPTYEQHIRWLVATLERETSVLAVIEMDGAAAGMIRLDRSDSTAAAPRYEVSIAIGTAYHGRGIGSAALRLIREQNPNAILDAYVLPANEASLRMFAREGYIDIGNGYYRNNPRGLVAPET